MVSKADQARWQDAQALHERKVSETKRIIGRLHDDLQRHDWPLTHEGDPNPAGEPVDVHGERSPRLMADVWQAIDRLLPDQQFRVETVETDANGYWLPAPVQVPVRVRGSGGGLTRREWADLLDAIPALVVELTALAESDALKRELEPVREHDEAFVQRCEAERQRRIGAYGAVDLIAANRQLQRKLEELEAEADVKMHKEIVEELVSAG